MIVQVIEQYHDYEKRVFYVETDKLNPDKNPIDAMVLKACKKKAFNQEVYINAREKQDAGEDNGFWEEPDISNANVKLKKGTKPEKTIMLTIYFDC